MADPRGRTNPATRPSAGQPAHGAVRLVLFDIDGTLVSTGGAGMKAFGEAFEAAFGIGNVTGEIKFAGRTDYSLFREMCRHGGIDCTAETRELFFSHYLRLVDSHLDANTGGPFPGVVRMLDALAAMPDAPTLGLLTGNIREGARRKLGTYGLWDRFALGGFSDDDEDRNRIAAAAKARGGEYLECPLDGPEIVVVGDTPRDVACGRHIGARTLAVATGGATLEALQACEPDWAVPDLTHLSAAELCSG
ncbi:MAG: HAD family hydrolase [Verrucomicrobia bacterium]|nr:HAD family hydrolase [Verrucomicrobiota bacterium]